MPDVVFTNVPDEKAIAFLRQKLNITTRNWDDFLKEIHAKAFTVAGATKLALLKDLRHAVTKAIENGESIGEFRKRFDHIVDDHGWSYKGKRGWRTRVIYDNNLRSAHMAGRWDQIQQNKNQRPYLMYRTVGDGRVRAEHRGWDNTILPVDDPFWNTHYPPNGYGCRCDVRTVSERDLERKGWTISDRPEIKTTPRKNSRTGEDYGDVPEGIDVGWNYNVGQAWLGGEKALGDQLVDLPRRVQDQFNDHSTSIYNKLQDAFSPWAKQVLDKDHPRRQTMVAGYLSGAVIKAVRDKAIKPRTAAITLSADRLRRMERDIKKKKGQDVPRDLIVNIPTGIKNPTAILWDKKKDALLYVVGNTGEREFKLFVMINFKEKRDITNSIRSGGVVPLQNLKDENHYELLEGSLD